MSGKGFSLWIYSQLVIVGDKHLLRRLAPARHLGALHTERFCLSGMALHRFCGPAQIVLGHQVGIDVVISYGTILVRPGYSIDAKLVSGGDEVAKRTPQPHCP